MRPSLRFYSRFWPVAPLAALGFVCFVNSPRIDHAQSITALTGEAPALDPKSLTGYAGGLRHFVVPEHNVPSFQWIAQTQQVLAEGRLRLRHVTYDNAPSGRDVMTSSPYRWWLGLLARIDAAVSSRPVGVAVERAALGSDPILLGVFVLALAAFAAWRFGALSAVLLPVGLALLHPLASAFLPGQPDDFGLALGVALGSGLLLTAGCGSGDRASRWRWFLGAGLLGGFGLWLSVRVQVPLLVGTALGAVLAACVTRWRYRRREALVPPSSTSDNPSEGAAAGAEPAPNMPPIEPAPAADPTPAFTPPEPALPWRAWALGGAAATLVGYLIDSFPAGLLRTDLQAVQPLLALGWLALGHLLALATGERTVSAGPRRRIDTVITALAALVVVAVPALAIGKGGSTLFADDLLASRLAGLPGSPIAESSLDWFARDGTSVIAIATLAPLLAVGAAAWLLVRRATTPARLTAVAVALGPVLVAVVIATLYLRWWAVVDTAVLALVAAAVARLNGPEPEPRARVFAAGALAIAALLGVVVVWPATADRSSDTVSETEAVSLVERDLAHWLAGRAGSSGATVLASPNLTAALCYYGGLRGLGTPYRENREGFFGSARIASATLPDEAMVLAQQRGITHVVVASWDPYLDQYAKIGSGQMSASFVSLLHQWLPPRWLRPVAYPVPQMSGFENQTASVFEVTEVQDNATALGRLAEYFVEMGLLENANRVSSSLEHLFPTDPGALVARAVVARAYHDEADFAAILRELLPLVSGEADHALPWDRQVSLAVVLAQARRPDLARDQLNRCLDEVDEARLRALSAGSLYRFAALLRAFSLTLPDEALQSLMLQRLPPELREKLQP